MADREKRDKKISFLLGLTFRLWCGVISLGLNILLTLGRMDDFVGFFVSWLIISFCFVICFYALKTHIKRFYWISGVLVGLSALGFFSLYYYGGCNIYDDCFVIEMISFSFLIFGLPVIIISWLASKLIKIDSLFKILVASFVSAFLSCLVSMALFYLPSYEKLIPSQFADKKSVEESAIDEEITDQDLSF